MAIKSPDACKPVDKIVADIMSQAVAQQTAFTVINGLLGSLYDAAKSRGIETSAPPDLIGQFPKTAARMLLLTIAEDAPIDVVLKALGAVGAPSSLDLIAEGVQAAKEARPLA